MLFTCIALSLSSQSQPINETGNYFLHVNKVYASYSSWLVIFTHDLKPFETSIRKVQSSLETFSKAFAQMMKRPIHVGATENTQEAYEKLRSKLSALYENEYQHIEKSLGKVQNAFDNLKTVTTLKEPTRTKRAVLPFIGDIASKLFGVATEGDIKHVNKGLKSLKGSGKKTLHLLKDSMSVVNKTDENVKLNRQIINQLVEATHLLDTKFDELYEKHVMKLSFNIDHTEMAVELHSIYHIINSALESLTTMFIQMSSQINDLHMGTLPYDLAPPKTLRNILLEIQKQLPPTLMLPHPVALNLNRYYKILHAVLIPDIGKFHVLTSIPLAHTKDLYDVYKIINLPVPMSNVKAVKYIPEYPYLATTQDKSSYALMTTEEAAHCHHDNFDYCPLTSPSYDTDLYPRCIMSLFMKDSAMIKSHCKPKVVKASVAPLLKHIVNGKWLSSSIKPYKVEMACDKENEIIHVQKGIQVIDLKQGCNAFSSYFRLPPFFRQKSSYELTKSFKVLLDTPIQLEGIETDQNPLPKLNESLLSQIPQLIDIQPDLDQMKHDIGNAITDVEQIKIETSNPVLLYVAMILAAVALMLSMMVILVYYKKRCISKFNGYLSHKREKAIAKDKKEDIQEAVQMTSFKTQDARPDQDCKQCKETLVLNFTDKLMSAKDFASK